VDRAYLFCNNFIALLITSYCHQSDSFQKKTTLKKIIKTTLSLIAAIAFPFSSISAQNRGGDFNIEYLGKSKTDPAKEDSTAGKGRYKIVVTGTMTGKNLEDTPVVTEVISSNDINESRAENLSDVFEDYGIMQGKNEMGSYISLQGLGDKRILFLINGREITGRVAGRVNTDALPVGNIESIEIIRGPQSALYGSDAIGGVINIRTKKPTEGFSGRLKVTNNALSSDDFFFGQDIQADAGFRAGALSGVITGNYSRSGDYYLNDNPYAALSPVQTTGAASIDLSLGASVNSVINAGGSFSHYGTTRRVSEIYEEIRPAMRSGEYIELDHSFNSGNTLLLRVSHNYYDKDAEEKNLIDKTTRSLDQNATEHDLTADIIYSHQFSSVNILTVTGQADYDRLKKYNIAGGEGIKSVNVQAIGVQDELLKKNVYSVVFGVRAERNSNFGFFGAPKVSGLYHISRHVRLRAGIGMGYRAPDFNDLYIDHNIGTSHPTIKGNEDLEPEMALGENINLEASLPGSRGSFLFQGLYFRAGIYRIDLKDEIIYVTSRPRDDSVYNELTYENAGRSYRQGADAEGEIKFLSILTLSGGINYLYAYNKSENNKIETEPELTYRARLKCGIPRYGVMAHGGVRHTSRRSFVPMDYDDEGGIGVRAQTIWDLYLSKSFSGYFRLFAGVYNITDVIDGNLGPFIGRKFFFGAEGKL